jgi:hypothetical protein
VGLGALLQATGRQARDVGFCPESFIRHTCLVLFMRALIVFIASLVIGSVLWAALSLFVMLPTFTAGEQFAVKVPNVHLTEFTDAVAHGCVSWTIDTLGI